MVDVTSTPGATQQIGPHVCWFEPPSILHLRIVGNVELPHAQVITDTVMTTAVRIGPLYFLRDARRGGVITRQAREHIMREMKPNSIIATITYGASFHNALLVTMIMRALRALGKPAPLSTFVPDEAAARAWVDNHRATTKAK